MANKITIQDGRCGMARKPGRPRAGAELLSREVILTVALQIVDADGAEALTMRHLAKKLGVDPMAIYRHLPDKAALIDGVVALVFGDFQTPSPVEADWRVNVRAFAAAYRALARAHPNLILYLITHVDASAPAVLAVGEFLAATLSQAGLRPQQVVTALNLIIDYLNGFVLGEGSGRMGAPGEFAELFTLLNTLPAGHYPAMAAVYGALDESALQAHVMDELEVILAGI